MKLTKILVLLMALKSPLAQASPSADAPQGWDGLNITAAASELGDFVMSLDILKTAGTSALVLYRRLGFHGPVTKNSFYVIGNFKTGRALLAGTGGLTGEDRSTPAGDYVQLNAFNAFLNDSIIPEDESSEGLSIDFSSGLQGIHDRLSPHRPRILTGFFSGGALASLRPESAVALYRRILSGEITVTVPHRLRRSYVLVEHPIVKVAFHLSAPLHPEPGHSMMTHPGGPVEGLKAFKRDLSLKVVFKSKVSEVPALPLRLVLTPEMLGPGPLATEYAPHMAVIELSRGHFLVLPNLASPFSGIAQAPQLLHRYLKNTFGISVRDFSAPLLIDSETSSYHKMALVPQTPELLSELFDEHGVYLQSGVNYSTVMGYYLAVRRAEGVSPYPAILECREFLQRVINSGK